MKINNKGYASTIIMFSILTLFLISMLMLVKTMNNSSSLNKKITEKVVDNIDYDASGTVQDQILELKTTITSMQNQIDNIKGEVINEIYPVGSIYMSTEDDTVEKVQDKFGGKWEIYANGRTLVSAGTYTKSDGNTIVYKAGDSGGNVSTTLTSSNIPSLSVTGTTNSSGQHNHSTIGYVYESGRSGTLPAFTIAWAASTYKWAASAVTGGDQTASGYTTTNGAHTHTFTGNYTNNNVKDISIQNPYIVVYMYRRIN